MKKKVLSTAATLLLLLLVAACASNKAAKGSYPQYASQGNAGAKNNITKVEEQLNDCELEALNAPPTEMRAYGSATDEDADFARHQAVLFAKANLADQIESIVLNVMKGYRNKIQANGKVSNEADIKQDVGSMSEKVLANCRITCSKRYRLSNGAYECAVCVSIPSVDTEKIAGAAAINDDERAGIEFREKQFRDSYREELERFRQMQKEQR